MNERQDHDQKRFEVALMSDHGEITVRDIILVDVSTQSSRRDTYVHTYICKPGQTQRPDNVENVESPPCEKLKKKKKKKKHLYGVQNHFSRVDS